MFVPQPLSLFARRCAGMVWCAAAVNSLVGVQAQVLPAEQEFTTRRWDARDGLPGGAINAICQTADGFLWLATKTGLARFDGIQFKTFTTHAAMNDVSNLLADSDGSLWLGTPDGLARFKAGRLEELEVATAPGAKAITTLVRDKEGAIWSATVAGNVARISLGRREHIPPPSTAATNAWLVANAAGEVDLISDSAFYHRRDNAWAADPEAPEELKSAGAVCPSADGGLWFSVGREIKKFKGQPPPASFEPEPADRDAPRSQITSLLEDRSARLWAGTHAGGVFCFSVEKGWRRVSARRPRPQGAVSAFYEDADGSVWVGTSQGSLHQIRRRLATSWSLPVAAHDSLPQTVCVTRDGSVWVGTDGAGAFRYRDGSFTRYGEEQGLANVTVVAILEDSLGALWFATLGGLFRFEHDSFYPAATNAVGQHVVSSLFEDRANNLWVGMNGAVARLRGEAATVLPLPERSRQFEVRAIAQTADGAMWFGSRGGGLLQLKRGQVVRGAGFGRPAVLGLYGDAEGALWIGTLNSGLFRLQDGASTRWTANEGLPSNALFSFVEDARGVLWINSNDGVFGVSKRALLELDRARGVPLPCLRLPVTDAVADEPSAGSGQPTAAKSTDGRLWFPTAHGMMSFQPGALAPQTRTAAVAVEEIWVDGAVRAAMAGAEVKLPLNVKRVEFHFASPELEMPDRLKFRYRLQGFDDGWLDAGAQRVAYYGQLPAGEYQFRVMAGLDNDWREAAQPLVVRVVPRFWETRWFQISGLVFVVFTVGGVARYVERAKLRRRLERLEMQQAMERERRRIARDLHDDLGSGITEIMLLGELATQEADAPPGSRSQMKTITEKVRKLASAMDEVVWIVNPKNDSLANLASYLCDYAREFFQASPVRCRIDVRDTLPDVVLPAHVRHNLFLAVKEALNNVAKHSGAGEVWLGIRHEAGQLVIAVEDDGKGFDPAAVTARGSGLPNLRARLTTIGGDARIDSEVGQGTTVTFRLGLSADSFRQEDHSFER